MDRIDEINLQRVRWCCDEAGIEPDDLSDALGISHVTIEKFLQGECGLNFNQLQKMAGFFDRGMLFFLNPKPVDESRVLSPHCRTLANQKPDVTLSVTGWVRKVERQREIYLSLREELDAPVPKVRFPKVNARKPAEAAQIIRKWLGLGDRADFDTFRNAIEAKHILVFRSNGYAGDWQIPKNSPVIGFSLYYEQCPVIVVKKQRWESRQNFTLLHELAHLILHQESMMDEESDLLSHETKEREANQFAGCLLVPDRFLDRIPIEEKPEHAGRYDDWLKPCRTQWGASTECILLRLLDAGRINRAEVNAYQKLERTLPEEGKGTRMYRYREPRNIFGDGFVKTVLDAYNARRIPATRASKYLDKLKLSDLHKLEGFYARV